MRSRRSSVGARKHLPIAGSCWTHAPTAYGTSAPGGSSETREKYQASHEIRPYRLHIYEVPVWRLPVDVRRGDRRYPLTLDWLIPLDPFRRRRLSTLRCR